MKFCSIIHIEKFYLWGNQWNDFPPITENSILGRQFKRDSVCFKLNSLAWANDAIFSSILLFDKLQSQLAGNSSVQQKECTCMKLTVVCGSWSLVITK